MWCCPKRDFWAQNGKLNANKFKIHALECSKSVINHGQFQFLSPKIIPRHFGIESRVDETTSGLTKRHFRKEWLVPFPGLNLARQDQKGRKNNEIKRFNQRFFALVGKSRNSLFLRQSFCDAILHPLILITLQQFKPFLAIIEMVSWRKRPAVN